ncbi:MAG: DUF551 domain-containing protein [Lachnospiraceae bacterium]|nr:DUF551 domain-containing protein [Lachnospiraceae bacterium]MBD5505987.1 DUF551 domain-containing protein [Lachnospiraceae bacterium]
MIDEQKLIERIKEMPDTCNLFRWRSSKKIKAGLVSLIAREPKISEWIPCSERLPTMEECYRNDCRFILDDGNRRYQGIFDYIEKRFERFNFGVLQIDKCAIAWQPLPEGYQFEIQKGESENEKSITNII